MNYVAAKGREKLYDSVLSFLQGSEERLVRTMAANPTAGIARGLKLPVTHGDVAFLIEEVYRGRSVVTGVPTKLVLIRWRRPRDEQDVMIRIGGDNDGDNDTDSEQKSSTVRLGELVCMTKDEALRHERLVFGEGRSAEDLYGEEIVAQARERMALAERYEKYR